MSTTQKDEDEHYDRRQKGADETFCSSCGAIIKKEEENCMKCGVKNKHLSEEHGGNKSKPKGSMLWLIVFIFFFFPAAIIYYFMRRWD